MMWATWWLWGALALVLAIGEVLLPGYVLLGFALGAGLVSVVLLVGGPLALWLAGSVPVLLLAFAVASLVAWLLLRRVLGVQKGQVRTIDHDINEP